MRRDEVSITRNDRTIGARRGRAARGRPGKV